MIFCVKFVHPLPLVFQVVDTHTTTIQNYQCDELSYGSGILRRTIRADSVTYEPRKEASTSGQDYENHDEH